MSDLVKRLRADAALDKLTGARSEIGLSAEAASRIEALEAALRQARSCAYPVSTEIDPRGHRWSEAYLEQLLPAINDLLKD
jgi:hypothetical protein